MSRAPRQKKTSFRASPPSSSLSEMLFGPDTSVDEEGLVFGLLVTSLDHRDNKLLSQLKGVTDRSSIFQRLYTLDYEKSFIPMTSDPNPLGDIRANGVALVVEDVPWGPNLLKEQGGGGDDNPHYWHIMEAAQELAKVVVFVFIKGHKDSKDYPGVLHPKFHKIAKGPWPRKAPYVFLLSYDSRLNKAQFEAVQRCLDSEDNPLKIRIEFNNHIAAGREYLVKQNAGQALQSLDTSATEQKEGKEPEKGKDKETEEDHFVHHKEETLEDVKRQLRKENDKRWSQVTAQINELKAELTEVKKALGERDHELKALKRGLVRKPKDKPTDKPPVSHQPPGTTEPPKATVGPSILFPDPVPPLEPTQTKHT